MQSRSSSLSRSRNKSITVSNPNILSLSAYEQIFGSPIVGASPSFRPDKNMLICDTLQPEQTQQSALNIGIHSAISPSPLPCLIEHPCQTTPPPTFPQPRKIKTLGTQTSRTLLTTSSVQTDVCRWSMDNQFKKLQMKEAELADIQQSLQLQLEDFRNAKARLEAERKEIEKDKIRVKQQEKDIKIKQGKLQKQEEQVNLFRIELLTKKIGKIEKHNKKFFLTRLSQKIKETPTHTARLCNFKSIRESPLISPTATPNPKEKLLQYNRPLDFSFKDHRPSMPVLPLGVQNTNLSAKLPRRRAIVENQESNTRERVISHHADQPASKETSKQPSKKLLTRKGINYPLNYKK